MFSKTARLSFSWVAILLVTARFNVTNVHGQVSLQVSPPAVYVTDEQPNGHFELNNVGRESVEVIINVEYGVVANDLETGEAYLAADPGNYGDLTELLTYFPPRATIAPGRSQIVRFLVGKFEELPQNRAYVALMQFRISEQSSIPQLDTPATAAALQVVYQMVCPVTFLLGEGVSKLEVFKAKVDQDELRLMIQNAVPIPFIGRTDVYAGEVLLGKHNTTVFTSREVVIPVTDQRIISDSLSVRFQTEGLPRSVIHRFPSPASVDFVAVKDK